MGKMFNDLSPNENNSPPNLNAKIFPEFKVKYSKSKSSIFMSSSINDNLFSNIRPLLIVGKMIGLCSFGNVFLQSNPYKLEFKKLSISSFISLTIIIVFLGGNVVLSAIDMSRRSANHAVDYATAPSVFIFYLVAFYIHIFFYKRSKLIIELFVKWEQLFLQYSKRDTSLRRDCLILVSLILGSVTLENGFGHFRYFTGIPYSQGFQSKLETMNSTVLEIFYYRSQSILATSLSYSPLMLAYGFLSNKFAIYGWNFADIFIIVVARALYFKFKILYLEGERILCSGTDAGAKYDSRNWNRLTMDHGLLCDLVEFTEKLLSPLIFASYFLNIYYLCIKLHAGLSAAKSSLLVSTYTIWVFVQILTRIFMVTLAGARIHSWAHRISSLLKKCPDSICTMEVKRTEHYVGANIIALTGMGCFSITKQLMLSIVGVVFTFEIVLLQASQTQLPTVTEISPAFKLSGE